MLRNYLFSNTPETELTGSDPEYSNLLTEKEQVLNEIKDIDLDYGLEKLDENDYRELRKKYRYRAAEIIKKIDEYEKKYDAGIDQQLSVKIEEEVRLRKQNQN